MSDFRAMARDPEHRRAFEKLLYLAARRGDADLVAERLSWGVDPDCRSAKRGRTPLMANVCGSSPSAATARALLAAGADPGALDLAGLSALDYARRKLARLQAKPRRAPRKSPSTRITRRCARANVVASASAVVDLPSAGRVEVTAKERGTPCSVVKDKLV